MSFNFHLPYRQTEDVVREYASRTSISVPEYKWICRRINILNIIITSDDESSVHTIQEFQSSIYVILKVKTPDYRIFIEKWMYEIFYNKYENC